MGHYSPCYFFLAKSSCQISLKRQHKSVIFFLAAAQPEPTYSAVNFFRFVTIKSIGFINQSVYATIKLASRIGVKMNRTDGLVRRNITRGENGCSEPNSSQANSVDDNDVIINERDDEMDDHDSKETRLTLMEEVLLLGLKDKEVGIDVAILLGGSCPNETDFSLVYQMAKV